MALARTDLSPVVQVGAATTVGIVTVGSGQTCYIKSILIYNVDANNSQDAEIDIVPNNSGNVGTAISTTQIARLGIGTQDTFFFEPAYPIVLRNNGDSLQITNIGVNTVNAINVLVTGDIDL